MTLCDHRSTTKSTRPEQNSNTPAECASGAEALGEGVGVQKSVRAPYPHPKCSAPLGAPGKGDGPGAGYLLGVGAVSRVGGTTKSGTQFRNL